MKRRTGASPLNQQRAARAPTPFSSAAISRPATTVLLSAILLGWLAAQPAQASLPCPTPSSDPGQSVTCTLGSSDSGSTKASVDFTGPAGSGTGIGGYGGNYTLTNNGATLDPSSPQAAIFVRLRGGEGSSDTSNNATNGGNGGTITITNSGSLSIYSSPTSSTQGSAPGIWDDAGAQFGIYAASVGGTGANANQTAIGGGNGGGGGQASAITINNSGTIQVGNLPYGGVGIYAAGIGGLGGDEDPAGTGDQNGGNGGQTNTVGITNSASITVSSSSASRYAWGIGVESIGGNGGHDNGNGGEPGGANTSSPSNIVNSGKITVQVNGGSGFTNGVRGLYILNQGGDGMTSEDGSDNGGAGANATAATVTNSAAITVQTNDGLAAPTSLDGVSGGIVLLARGGNGGMSAQTVTNTSGQRGGTGGSNPYTSTITMNSGSAISTTGNYLPGVVLVSQGGNGGAGREDADGADGGYGGIVNVYMSGDASIITNGVQSHGIAVRSAGGAGGGVETSSGLIDFTPENGGTGGAGKDVTITTGNMSQGLGGGTITTWGMNSVGILAQSMGGFGGGTTSNFEFFGDAGANAGNGGAPGSVTVNSMTGITTYGSSSHGIVAQSLGGGGGTAGASSGIVALGGSGGNAVNGGTVNVAQSAQLTTNGSSAIGILAQSIGGGGGDGGGSTGMVTIGGQAGNGGGSGGSATINLNGGSVNTSGDTSYGMVAQSIGGGGGTGGAASSFSASALFAMSVAVGGSGGTGGSGNAATANLTNSSITTGTSGTTATDAHGIVVQSIGGGGGAGGASVAQAYAVAVPDDSVSVGAAVTWSVGGSGGGGGAGGNAAANLSGSSVTTYGAGSFGMLVQSIGGGGGVGGSATSTSTVIGTESSAAATVSASFGGNGGSAGCSSDYSTSTCSSNANVSLQGDTRIQTWGDSANGIVAQTIGGGGGAGGIGSATGSSRNTDADISATISLGGTGSGGGTAGNVNFSSTYTDSVITAGDGARGVLLQSIGGGGGAAQGGQIGLALSSESEDSSTDVKGTVNVGRGGSSGGAGGTISITSNGQITTYGADADGLVAQSIGGSGGLGGVAGGNSADPSTGALRKAIGSLNDDGTSYELNIGVGGTGGNGGNGGAIGSSSTAASLGARINTFGDYADAVVLQSIGGGGGQGGASTTSSSSSSSHLTLSVGGKGGVGGSGGNIVAYFNDAFENGLSGNLFNTNGFGAHGIVLQSIGGGGGMGASGSPMANGTITVGRNGGGGGNGGTITVNQASWANISTHGDSAYGLVLQSIGGGGGIGMSGDSDAAASSGGQRLDLTLGGRNGATGSGGAINVSTGLGMNTYGARAIGVLVQSIGGGGGVASTGASSGLGSLSLGGGSGAGGAITLDMTGGSVTTRGDGAHGMVAQSIGGGGGIIGDTAMGVQLNPNGWGVSNFPSGTGGSGAQVSVTVDGTISTSGRNAFGIIAQSIGGGGGLGGSAQGGFAGNLNSANSDNGGLVAVTLNGAVSATGTGSTGIFAQSQGPDSNSAITVNVNGSVTGGSGSNGYGVWIAQGINNALNVGTGGSIGAASGTAVHYDGDTLQASGNKLTITNNGLINGSVQCTDADTGANCGFSSSQTAAPVSFAVMAQPSAPVDSGSVIQLHNQQGGTLAGASVYQADVSNEGLLVIGNPGPFNELRITGSLVQAPTGVLRGDADFDKLLSDHLTVQGNATLAGAIDAVPSALLPNREVTMVTVQGQAQGSLQALDSPVIDYGVRQDGQDYKVRAVSANFNAPSMDLSSNQSNVAGHLQRIWDAGGNSALAPLFAQMDLASRAGGGAYRHSIDSLAPGAAAAPAAQSMAALGQFTGNMMSCPAFTGADAMTGEQNCFWGLVSGRSTTQDASRGNSDFDYDSVTYQFGGQRQISPGWFLGGSMAYQNNDLKGDSGRLNGNGDSGYAGLVLKRESGAWTFSGALGGGYGSYRLNRDVIVPGYQDTVKSNPDLYNFGLRLRVARTFSYEKVYLKPYLDFDANYTRMSSYSESGNNALGLSVDSSHQYVLGVSPMFETGGKTELGNGAVMRPFAYVGVTFLNKESWDTTSRLQGAPAGTGSFDTSLPMDDVIGRIGAGLQVATAKGVDFRLQYDGELASHTRSHSGSLKVMIPF